MAIDSVENLRNCKYTWGTLNVDKFVKKLNEEGIRDVKIEPSASGSIIHLVRYLILASPNWNPHIVLIPFITRASTYVYFCFT